MPEIGLNYRIPDILCALGHSQLGKLEKFVARRRELAARYDATFRDRRLNGVVPTPKAQTPDGAWHLYQVAIDFNAIGRSRSQVMNALRGLGIGTQVHYIPVHSQPYYRKRYGALSLPGAERFYARTLSLPLFPAMQDGDVDRVVDALQSVLLS
jgi:dTDP-4-amino-4,6-dideoxygalactose transaminase